MTKLSLGQAAKHAKRSKGTISNALNNGNLSGEKVKKNGRDTWEIEPSELQRWMDNNPSKEHQEIQNKTHHENIENTLKTNALEAELKAVREMLEREREQAADQIADLRRRLDSETEERRKLTAQLTDQRQAQPEPPKRGFWARLVGK